MLSFWYEKRRKRSNQPPQNPSRQQVQSSSRDLSNSGESGFAHSSKHYLLVPPGQPFGRMVRMLAGQAYHGTSRDMNVLCPPLRTQWPLGQSDLSDTVVQAVAARVLSSCPARAVLPLTAAIPQTVIITERVIGNVVVLGIDGWMTTKHQQLELSGLVTQRLAAEHRDFMLDLGYVPRCDARGVSELNLSRTLAETAQAKLKLANVRPDVYGALHAAGMAHLFPVFDCLSVGLASFRS